MVEEKLFVMAVVTYMLGLSEALENQWNTGGFDLFENKPNQQL